MKIHRIFLTLCAGIASLVLLVVLCPYVASHLILNLAQLNRIQGRIDSGLYQQALAVSPDNENIRLKTGVALADIGDAKAALAVLEKLNDSERSDPNEQALLLSLLALENRNKEALVRYQAMLPSPRISAGVAAKLANELLKEESSTVTVSVTPLLKRVFGLDSHKYLLEVLEDTMRISSTSSSALLAERTREALRWRANDGSTRISNTATPTRTDMLEVVSKLTGVPTASLTFGPEQIVNGSFESVNVVHDLISGWSESFMATGHPWNLGAFVTGPDQGTAFSGKRSLRIDGLYVERASNLEPARAGYVHDAITVTAGTPYVMSFAYRTEGMNPKAGLQATIWLSSDAEVLFSQDHLLPDTGGQWKQVTLVAWNRSADDEMIRPILRSFSEGNVWFDSFSIRRLYSSLPLAPQSLLIDIQ